MVRQLDDDEHFRGVSIDALASNTTTRFNWPRADQIILIQHAARYQMTERSMIKLGGLAGPKMATGLTRAGTDELVRKLDIADRSDYFKNTVLQRAQSSLLYHCTQRLRDDNVLQEREERNPFTNAPQTIWQWPEYTRNWLLPTWTGDERPPRGFDRDNIEFRQDQPGERAMTPEEPVRQRAGGRGGSQHRGQRQGGPPDPDPEPPQARSQHRPDDDQDSSSSDQPPGPRRVQPHRRRARSRVGSVASVLRQQLRRRRPDSPGQDDPARSEVRSSIRSAFDLAGAELVEHQSHLARHDGDLARHDGMIAELQHLVRGIVMNLNRGAGERRAARDGGGVARGGGGMPRGGGPGQDRGRVQAAAAPQVFTANLPTPPPTQYPEFSTPFLITDLPFRALFPHSEEPGPVTSPWHHLGEYNFDNVDADSNEDDADPAMPSLEYSRETSFEANPHHDGGPVMSVRNDSHQAPVYEGAREWHGREEVDRDAENTANEATARNQRRLLGADEQVKLPAQADLAQRQPFQQLAPTTPVQQWPPPVGTFQWQPALLRPFSRPRSPQPLPSPNQVTQAAPAPASHFPTAFPRQQNPWNWSAQARPRQQLVIPERLLPQQDPSQTVQQQQSITTEASLSRWVPLEQQPAESWNGNGGSSRKIIDEGGAFVEQAVEQVIDKMLIDEVLEPVQLTPGERLREGCSIHQEVEQDKNMEYVMDWESAQAVPAQRLRYDQVMDDLAGGDENIKQPEKWEPVQQEPARMPARPRQTTHPAPPPKFRYQYVEEDVVVANADEDDDIYSAIDGERESGNAAQTGREGLAGGEAALGEGAANTLPDMGRASLRYANRALMDYFAEMMLRFEASVGAIGGDRGLQVVGVYGAEHAARRRDDATRSAMEALQEERRGSQSVVAFPASWVMLLKARP